MDKGVIENFYHITTMNEFELDETNTYIVKFFSKPHGLLYIYIHSNKINSLLKCTHYRKWIPLSLYSMYACASNNTPPYTHISLYMVRRVHPPGARVFYDELNNIIPSLKTNISS